VRGEDATAAGPVWGHLYRELSERCTYVRYDERGCGLSDWEVDDLLAPQPAKRGGLIFPIEGGRWMVTLCGWHGDHPGADEEGFLDFAARLPAPDLHRWIADAEPLTPIVAHGFPANWRRHYERMERFPEGLVVVGDAVCSFNPVYGQGMTVAAIEATALGEWLRGRRRAAAFRHEVARIVEPAWQMTTGEDMRFAETIGRRSPAIRFLHAYTALVHRAAGSSPRVAERFYRVMNMVDDPATLFAPALWLALARCAVEREGCSARAVRRHEAPCSRGRCATGVGIAEFARSSYLQPMADRLRTLTRSVAGDNRRKRALRSGAHAVPPRPCDQPAVLAAPRGFLP
jgi:hypothetical protein